MTKFHLFFNPVCGKKIRPPTSSLDPPPTKNLDPPPPFLQFEHCLGSTKSIYVRPTAFKTNCAFLFPGCVTEEGRTPLVLKSSDVTILNSFSRILLFPIFLLQILDYNCLLDETSVVLYKYLC